MNILFVLAHPEPTSFNGQLVATGKDYFEAQGHHVEVSDLYALDFDPVEKAANYPDRINEEEFAPLAEQRHAYKEGILAPEIQQQIEMLERADLVIFQFPIWWHSVPAMLKGWCDRVFVSGGLYTSKMRYDNGYFRGKRAMCSVTSGAPGEAFVAGGRGGELDQILWSMQFSLYYMGFDVLPPHASFGVSGHGYSYVADDAFEKQFATLKQNWIERLSSIQSDTPMTYPGWDDWDDLGQPKMANA
ncbi:NAD(P)H dehydrogenase (quinone) [Maritalea myrionectae]|uniref:NAD(P)H dehydrogenase (Quinone) n=1 Tax=Maritalea myrionectae TaxID=454601 RepID=A0A2R4MIV8_9HYPH|nr:NAD(P)H-dependent oxidoreductase [Maritalea myrionectae]AVX05869.1 NAD(P)H dehydrogenase (quinone) [Maritalea myrionectae]